MEDRRAVAAQRRLDQDGAGQPGIIDAGDPYAAAWKNQLAPPQPGWQFGVIVDVLPGGYAYRVSAGKQSFLWCSPGGTTAGFGVTGGRSLTTLVVGTPVWFVKHPETPSYGTIVQAEPHPSAHTANQPADTIWPFIRSGQRAEIAHQYPLIAAQNLGSAGVTPIGNTDGADFSAGRPLDATAVGEWGVMMETGLGVFADPFQAFMRVDETTGVFMFYPDQMLRIAGQNFQQFTSLAEVEHLEDEGELAGMARKTVYPWENRGLWRWNQVTAGWTQATVTPNHGYPAGQGLALNDPLATQSAVGVATSEPEQFTQISAARGFEYTGYLGQGGTTLLAAPAQLGWAYPSVPSGARTTPAGWVPGFTNGQGQPVPGAFAPSGRLTINQAQGPAAQPYVVPPNTRETGPAQPGLFEEHKTLAGGWHVRSATRVILAKRSAIPVPRPLRRQEDPYGDSPLTGPSNYRASGLNNGVNEHLVRSGLTAPPSGPPQRASNLFDILSYAFNWENVHPFAYHSRDWSLAQEGAAGSALVNTRVPNYLLLAAQQYLAAPTPAALDIDHRYGLTPIYENESSVCLLEDGTVLITDGWGSEIRMHSGNIDLRCAGDISMHPGRNLIVWAGHDAVIKAHDCVDLTAANGDLRTKAERNSHHLAGNSGCGGFLFEAKSTCPVFAFDGVGESVANSGFTVLTPRSEFLVLARDVALNLEEPVLADAERGKITFDAGAGGHIRTFSKSFTSKFNKDGYRVHLFDGKTSNGTDLIPGTNTANEFSATYTYLGNNLNVYGTGFFWADLTTAGTLVSGYHIQTIQAAANSYLVSEYTNLTYLDQRIAAIETRYDYLVDTYAPAVVGERAYPEGAEDAEFTHRNNAQYRTDSWTFWESRWHTMARDDNQLAVLWSEPIVTGLRSESVTLPHPGARWTESDGYRGQDPGFTNFTAGWVAINRNTFRTTYESAMFPAARTPVALEAAYTVTVQPRVN